MSMILPINKSCHKIIDYVYKSNGIKISRLLRETSVSQRIGYQHIKELINDGVLKVEIAGQLRIIKPNLKSETGKLIFGLIEKQRESKLIEEKPELKKPLEVLKKEAGAYGIESIVLFGQFVKNKGNEKIDMLVISEVNDKKILPFLQKSFGSIENAVSARIMNSKSFLKFKATKKELYDELFSNHICIYNVINFINLIA